MLVDFEYTYNLREYYDWLVVNREHLEQDRKEGARDFLEKLDVKDIRTRALKSLAETYEWSRAAVTEQLSRVAGALGAE